MLEGLDWVEVCRSPGGQEPASTEVTTANVIAIIHRLMLMVIGSLMKLSITISSRNPSALRAYYSPFSMDAPGV